MTRIMVCGLRSECDISLLVSAGVDAIGLITEVCQAIPCKLTRESARRFVRITPPLTLSVLIITEERIGEIVSLGEYVKPGVIQLHGFNQPDDIPTLKQKLNCKIIKTLHFNGKTMREGGEPASLALEFIRAGADAILIDSVNEKKVGSTGEVMDLALAQEIRDTVYPAPLILAGGLNQGNVGEAIKKVRPYAVDVFSGVTTGGYLDANKIAAFVAAVSRA